MNAEPATTTLDENTARQLTTRIQILVRSVQQSVDQLGDLISEAYAERAWIPLGYASWDVYVTAEFGASRIRLDRDERQEIVVQLRSAGMSRRAIGSALGTSKSQVDRDLSGVPNGTPEPVTGIDGKTYTPRPESEQDEDEVVDAEIVDDYPQPPAHTSRQASRQPLPEFAKDAGWALRKDVERIERVLGDDRYSRNKEQVATHLRGHLAYAIETCNQLLDQLTHAT